MIAKIDVKCPKCKSQLQIHFTTYRNGIPDENFVECPNECNIYNG